MKKQEENNIAEELGINKHTTQYMIAQIGILHGLSAIYIHACKVLAEIYFVVFVPIAKKRIKQQTDEWKGLPHYRRIKTKLKF